MSFLRDHCTFRPVSEVSEKAIESFNCNNADLNEFLQKDCKDYANQLLGKTYCFTLDKDEDVVVCMFTVANDSVKASLLPNARKKKLIRRIPHVKHQKSYPAVLIGRLGVNQDYQGIKHDGVTVSQELMEFIKSWFIDSENKTGCRFVVVDAYNEEAPRRYYERNDFVYLFSSEEQEKEHLQMPKGAAVSTRLMYFDLVDLSAEEA